MNAPSDGAQPLTMERLHLLRRATERVSRYLHDQTLTYLEALRPALLPQRILGKYIEHPGNRDVAGSEKVWARFLATYRKIAGKPFNISTDLPTPLAHIDPAAVLYPWEYLHEARAGGSQQVITVTCPTRWVVSFRSSYSLAELRQAIRPGQTAEKERVQQFVVNSLLMGEVLRSVPHIDTLFEALRLKLGQETSPETGGMPFTTISSSVPAMLPGDDVVLPTTELTGVPRFMEIIDVDSVATLPDPVRDAMQKLIDETTGG